MILLVELALISPLFAMYYSHKQYIISREAVELGNQNRPRESRYHGASRALVQLFNWTEIVKGIAYGVKLMTSKEERDGGYLMTPTDETHGLVHQPALPYPEQQYPAPHYAEQQHLAPQHHLQGGVNGGRY